MPAWVKTVISNPEVIAINQSPLGLQSQVVDVTVKGIDIGGYCLLFTCTSTETWVKQLGNESVAVMFFNRAYDWAASSSSFRAENITITWKQLGWQVRVTLEFCSWIKFDNQTTWELTGQYQSFGSRSMETTKCWLVREPIHSCSCSSTWSWTV